MFHTIYGRAYRIRDARLLEQRAVAGSPCTLKLPGLQRARCVACNEPADAICAKCGVTPYCSSNCQRKDWNARHKNVCHNLQRLVREANGEAETDAVSIAPVTPLRRPSTYPTKVEPRDDSNSGAVGRNFRPGGAPKDPTKRNSFNRENNTNSNYNRNDNRYDGNRNDGNRNDGNWNDGVKKVNMRNGEREDTFSNRNNVQNYRTNQVNTSNSDTNRNQAVTPKVEPLPEKPKQESIPAAVPKTEAAITTAPAAPMLSVADVTPQKKFTPKNYMMDLLTPGTTAVLICESRANTRADPNLMLCLSMHDDFQTDYTRLCEDYAVACEADKEVFTPAIGELFSLLNPDDGGWYRARLLNNTLAALIDSSKVVTFKPPGKKLSADYAQIPEMCCLLQCKDVKDGDSVQCTILSKTADGVKVSLKNVETGAEIGEGLVTRWIPHVEISVVSNPVTSNPAPTTEIPTVPRPTLKNKSGVHLVDGSNLQRALVRSSDPETVRAFDNVVQETLLFASTASPLKEPPQKGQLVIGHFTDGFHYRALCKRTSVKQNKYLIEYIEYGNEEITSLEKLYPCPPNLSLEKSPCHSSIVKLSSMAITPPAAEYLQKLGDEAEPLLLTLPSGEESAPSGSEVVLTVVNNKENVNKTVEKMCTPAWKEIKDVVETKRIMFNELAYNPLPETCELDVLDISEIKAGSLSCCVRNDKHYDFVTGPLTARITEYCLSDIGKEPYLPMPEELCIAQYPPDPTWYRAVLLEQVSGPGSPEARVMYVDYGNMAVVPCAVLRKMLPEFVEGVPALASHADVAGFPKDATPEMLARSLIFMKVNDEGRGVLKPDKIVPVPGEDGCYNIHCQALLDAMQA